MSTSLADKLELEIKGADLAAHDLNTGVFDGLIATAREAVTALRDPFAALPMGWIVIARGGKFTRGLYEKPTAEDFEIWKLDGDTAIPLFALKD